MEAESVIKPIGGLAIIIDSLSTTEYVTLMFALMKDGDERTEEERQLIEAIAKQADLIDANPPRNPVIRNQDLCRQG
jgi:hypothetical protein